MAINLPYYRPNQQSIEQGKKSSQYEDTDFIKIKDGRNLFRILPPWDETGEFAAKVAQHWKIPGSEKPLPCLGAWPGLRMACPICEVLANASHGVDRDSLSAWTPRKGVRMNVIDRIAVHHGEKPKVKILNAPVAVYSQICNALSDPKFMDALNPIEGTDIEIVRSGKDLGTKYSTAFLTNNALSPIDPPAIKSSLAGTEEEIVALIKSAPNLSKVFHPPYEDELQSMWTAAKKLYEHIVSSFNIDSNLIPSGITPLTHIPDGIPKKNQGSQGGGRMAPPPATNQPQQAAASPATTFSQPQPVAPVATPVQPAAIYTPPVAMPQPVAPVQMAQPVAMPQQVTMAPPVAMPVAQPFYAPAPVAQPQPVMMAPQPVAVAPQPIAPVTPVAQPVMPAPVMMAPAPVNPVAQPVYVTPQPVAQPQPVMPVAQPVAQPIAQPMAAPVAAPVAPVPVRMPEAPVGVEVSPAVIEAQRAIQQEVLQGKPSKPVCYGGLQPHEHGRGFSPLRPQCIACLYEAECTMDTASNKTKGSIQ